MISVRYGELINPRLHGPDWGERLLASRETWLVLSIPLHRRSGLRGERRGLALDRGKTMRFALHGRLFRCASERLRLNDSSCLARFPRGHVLSARQ